MSPLKVVVYCTYPTLTTGYARVANELLTRLDGDPALDLHVYGIQNDPRKARELCYRTVSLYDAAANEGENPSSGFGMFQFADYLDRVKPDVLFIYNDPYVVSHVLQQVGDRNVRVVVYLDMFYANFYTHYTETIGSRADRILVFSPCWQSHLSDLGLASGVLEHGFAADKFRPVDKAAARDELGLPQDAFIVLNWNRNLVRKRLDIFLMALVRLVVANPKAHILALLNSNKEVSFDVFDILRHEFRAAGLRGDAVEAALGCCKVNYTALTDEQVNLVYNAADIGVNTCEGEGFGLCNFEHAGVGRPQVVSRVGGLADIFDDTCAQMADPVSRYYLDLLTRDAIGGLAEVVDPQAVCHGMHVYLNDPALRARHGGAAAARVRAKKYEWDTVARRLKDELKEVLEPVASDIDDLD